MPESLREMLTKQERYPASVTLAGDQLLFMSQESKRLHSFLSQAEMEPMIFKAIHAALAPLLLRKLLYNPECNALRSLFPWALPGLWSGGISIGLGDRLISL